MLHLAEHWMAHHLLTLERVVGLEQIGITKHVLAMFMVVGLLLLTFIPFGRRVKAA